VLEQQRVRIYCLARHKISDFALTFTILQALTRAMENQYSEKHVSTAKLVKFWLSQSRPATRVKNHHSSFASRSLYFGSHEVALILRMGTFGPAGLAVNGEYVPHSCYLKNSLTRECLRQRIPIVYTKQPTSQTCLQDMEAELRRLWVLEHGEFPPVLPRFQDDVKPACDEFALYLRTRASPAYRRRVASDIHSRPEDLLVLIDDELPDVRNRVARNPNLPEGARREVAAVEETEEQAEARRTEERRQYKLGQVQRGEIDHIPDLSKPEEVI